MQDSPSASPPSRGAPDRLAWLSGWVVTCASTAALAAIGWFGHASHWTFGLGGHHAAEHAAHHGAEPAAEPPETPAPDIVKFPSQEAIERTGIEVVPVEKRPVRGEVACQGVVAYDERRVAQLSTRVPGSVWRVEKHLGDEVRRGDVLLVIDSQEVGRLKAELLNALVAHESRREQLAILEEVKGVVMGRQLREARTAVREARNVLMNAEQALVNLGFEVSIRDLESLDDEARASRVRTLGLPPALVAGIDPARVSSNLLPLYAPFDGIIVGREAVVGEMIEPTRPIFEVADVSTMLLVLDVSKEDANRVAIGQPVRFRPDGSTEEFASRITWISTEVNEETRTLSVRAEVPNRSPHPVATADQPRRPLRAHTYGSGRIEIDRRGAAIVVPRSSVQWDGSRWVVFAPAGAECFRALPVEPGATTGDLVEIAGAAVGASRLTHVVGSGSHVLKSRMLLGRLQSDGS